jgi:hypothetical protein
LKYSKANSVRTQEAVARFGKSARYPLCLAALKLWRVKDETRKYAKDAESLGELLVKAKRQKEQARALYERLYKGGKQKEVIQAAALLREIEEHLPKLQTGYEANVELFTIWSEQVYPLAVARFERELNAVDRAKDVKALKALQRVKKRWGDNANVARLKEGNYRTLEILKLLRDKTFKATAAAKGGSAAYIEAARGGDRALSDEFWSGRLTVRDIHSHLLRLGGSRLAGDKEGKEIRRLLSRLGIRPAEDQRGRKWKMPSPKKQEPKRPRGRPRKTKFHEDFTVVEPEHTPTGDEDDMELPPQPAPYVSPPLNSPELYDYREARCDLAAIERELARLRKSAGCALPRNLGRARKPEGQTKWRSEKFAAFLDSN